jgi:hypothetical protein
LNLITGKAVEVLRVGGWGYFPNGMIESGARVAYDFTSKDRIANKEPIGNQGLS